MSYCLHEQLEFIRMNSGITSLEMRFYTLMPLQSLITKGLVACLAKSLKILRLSEVSITAQELVSFLNNFS
ncbi:hypothetical protein BGZ74_003473, partial [Mortierella antarctica]